MTDARWQIVWHRRWIGLGSNGPYPPSGPTRGCVYSHRFRVGFVELRRWTYLYSRPKAGRPA